MTDTMTNETTQEQAEEKPTARKLLVEAINRHMDATAALDRARKQVLEAQSELARQQNLMDNAWRAAGCPTGAFKLWVFSDGYKVFTLNERGNGPTWLNYEISAMPEDLA